MGLITVVTINYNNHDGLLDTFRSVFAQTYRGFEYIVVDGSSTDGSVEAIKEHSARIAKWISEKDNGIYHAMNKGVAMASGEYILFLNSGDTLVANDSLLKAVAFLGKEDIISGKLQIVKGTRRRTLASPTDVTFELMARSSLPHPSTFIRSYMFSTVGPFDESLKICGDWKFYMKALFKNKCTYMSIPVEVSFFDTTGVSSNPKYNLLAATERKEVLLKDFQTELYEDYMYNNILLSKIRSMYVFKILKRLRFFRLFK